MNNNNSGGSDETRSFKPLNLDSTNKEVPAGQEHTRTAGQGKTRPAGQGQGQGQTRPAGQNRTRPAGQGQVRRRPAHPDEENSGTRVMQAVPPAHSAYNPQHSRRPGADDHIKTIYRKDALPRAAGRPGSAQVSDSQTRVMKAVTPDQSGTVRNGENVRQATHPITAVVHRPPGRGKAVGMRPAPKKGRRDDDGGGGGEAVSGALTSVMKAIIYIVFVLVISGFLSYFGITMCNDVFAFVKPDDETEITVPEYATINDISRILGSNDIIRYPSVFKLYAKLRHDSGEFIAGDYTVTPSMNYDLLLSKFKAQVKVRETVSITIPEGYTIDQIVDILVSKGLGTREGFIDVIQNGDFSKYSFNWFITEIEKNKSPDRKYRLEGYLFPDTYYFYSDSDEYTIIYKLLKNFNDKFDESYKKRCEELGYTVDQIITLSSMVQAEAKYASEYAKVSSVFHNRLNNPNGPTVGLLQSDPTIQYILTEHKAVLDKTDMEKDSPYNTYIYKGLPPGPIGNPSINAIQYALYPAETDYLYFVANSEGYHLFAATLEEHNNNRIAVSGG